MDASRVQTFLDCPERYRLAYQENLVKIVEGAVELPKRFGKALHAGLEAHYRGQSVQTSNQAFLSSLGAILDEGSDCGHLPHTGINTLDAYRRYWANQDAQWKVLAVEEYGTMDIGAEEPWEVKIDLVVQMESGIWAVDHKSTSKPLSEYFWKRFELNSQVSGYIAYCQQKYGQCSGLMINGIQVGYRKRAYKGEPAGAYWNFERQLINRNARQLEDWRLRMQRTIKRMRDTTAWEKNEGQCGWCSYAPLCLAVGDAQVKETLYQVVANPLAYLTHGEQR